MAVNALARGWNFETPDVNNLLSPIQAGIQDYRRAEQQLVENRRADEQLGMQRTRLGMDQARAQREDDAARVARLGREANAIHATQGPQRQAMWRAWTQSNPDVAQHMARFGIDPNDHVKGPQFIATEAGGYDDMKRRQQEAQLAATQAQTANIGKTSSIQEFEYARRNGFQGTYQDWQTSQENRSTKYGLNPIPYQKPDGSIGYMVPSTSGQTKDLSIPGGGKAMPKVADVQTPTEVITRDQFGNIIRREQKDIAGKEEQEQIGTSRGKAKVDLPAVEASANLMRKALDDVETAITRNPRMVGGVTGVLPNVTASARDAQAKIDQVQGKVFLQAFNSLRGGGAITEQEGAKAEAALSRLRTAAVGSEAYFAAINDVRNEVNALVELARSKAGAGAKQPAASAPSGGGWGIRRLD